MANSGFSCTFLALVNLLPHTSARVAAGMAAPAPLAYGESDDGDFEIHMDRIGRELQCRICMAAYDDAMVTRCDHYFCASCIASSIQLKKQCPLCKAPVTRRELRVDERMRALVKIYRSVLASHRMKNAYCSQLPASARSRSRRETASPDDGRRRISSSDAVRSMPPPPPRRVDEQSPAGARGAGAPGERGEKGGSDFAAETPVMRDAEKDREDGDSAASAGSARRKSPRTRAPGAGGAARKRKRRGAG